METPPKARGPGRSGPRRRTGCLTCRARKVRCDEAKPTCANCVRLRLQCVYKSVIVPGIRERGVSERARPRMRSTSSTTQGTGSPGEGSTASFGAVRMNEEVQNPAGSRAGALQPGSDGTGTGTGPSEFNLPFDMLGFIGEITSDLQQKHLDLTNGTIAPSSTAIPEVDDGLFHDERQMTWGPEVQGNIRIPEADPQRHTAEEWEELLLEHFRESEPPPTIFGPVDLEWRFVRNAILAETNNGSCRALLPALYCYSDIHKAWVEGTQWRFGPNYHAQASSEIQSYLLGEMSEGLLKSVFISVLLLMLAELISPENWRPATPYLHTSYLLLQRFHPRIQFCTGLPHLITSWVSLLDIKALIAGRDGDPLAEIGTLSPSTTFSTPNPIPSSTNDPQDDPLLSSPTYLITHSITHPAFTFFLKTQQLIRRIVIIDLHHRSRGTVSDEFEVLQIAHTVSGDLETLWNKRPKILDLYSLSSSSTSSSSSSSPVPSTEEGLYDSLAPPLAAAIVRTFRSYVASFLALFVYLHRVAFAIYPRTDRVYRAVDQIIHLAKEESARPHTRPSPTFGSDPNSTHGNEAGSIPICLIWPLFIAALEGSIEQRGWIVSEMQRMAALGPGKGHPNAGKALFLLEEMTRRQDASRTWADSRCVRRELFADFFVMI